MVSSQDRTARMGCQPFLWKLSKAVDEGRRLGFRGGLQMIHIGLLEPLLMKPFPLYVQARRLVLERRRSKTAGVRLAHWRSRGNEVVDRLKDAPRTDLLVDPDRIDRLRDAAGDMKEIVLADIDQDGFLRSRVGALQNVPTISPDLFMPRVRFEVTVVDLDGVLGVRKHFKGDVPAFLAELIAGHDLRKAGCHVPAILGVDFEELTITFEFIPGPVLREELARHGAILRDRDVAAHPSYQQLRPRKRRAKRIAEGRAALAHVLDEQAVERIFEELRKIHGAGYVLHDLKFGNIILKEPSGEPYFVDFDRARAYPELSRLAFRFLRDRDYALFNAHFGTAKLTQRRVQGEAGRRPLSSGLYAPIYIQGGIRFGRIWSADVGYGRWHYILRGRIPSLTDARVLDLGANDGFNGIQMMRQGAREVVAVEISDLAIRRGSQVKELFEWADNRVYRLVYVHDNMARLPQLALGTFDLVTALCSLYYLDDHEIETVVSHVATITDTFVLQCNTDRHIRRVDPRTFEKATVEYAINALRGNGFPIVRVVAPRGYSRPLVIGCQSP